MKQRKITITDEAILECYNAGLTLNQTAAKLNATTVTIWRRAKKLNLSWKDLYKPSGVKIDLDEILSGKHPSYQTFKLHNRLLKEHRKEYRCEICGLSEWNGKPIPLQLDHIDGNSHNHLFENLRMICPNCHAQTETYCGKNK
jgi:Zn finger protein HypA/HybF involved in hydrogenase expression